MMKSKRPQSVLKLLLHFYKFLVLTSLGPARVCSRSDNNDAAFRGGKEYGKLAHCQVKKNDDGGVTTVHNCIHAFLLP